MAVTPKQQKGQSMAVSESQRKEGLADKNEIPSPQSIHR